MPLAKLCPRHGAQPPGKCPECARAESATKRAKPNHREVYNTSRWGALRLKVLRRDKFYCSVCGQHNANQAAHIQPFTGGDDPLAWDESNLRAECAECNGREGGLRRHQ